MYGHWKRRSLPNSILEFKLSLANRISQSCINQVSKDASVIKKSDLRNELRNVEQELRKVKFERDSYKQIANHYSSPSDNHDHGKFARETIKDMKKKIAKKFYKSVNYELASIIKKTDDNFPMYVNDCLEVYGEDDTD